MARTAPVPNIPAIPGMNPGIFVMGGGGGGGGGDGKGGNGNKGAQGADGKNGGKGADGGGKGSGACGQGSTGSCTNCGNQFSAGDPVDVASGVVFTPPKRDLSLPGFFAFEILRAYSTSRADIDRGTGYGWALSVDWELEVGRRSIRVWNGAGLDLNFPLLREDGDQAARDAWALLKVKDGFILRPGNEFFHYFRKHPDGKYRIMAASYRNRGVITFHHDRDRLTRIVDTTGRTIVFNRDSHGRLTSLSVPSHEGRELTFAQYAYSDRGDLIGVSDADGHQWRFEYDGDHRMTRQHLPTGVVFQYTYDRRGRCVETWGEHASGSDPALSADVPKVLADGTTKAKGILHCVLDFSSDDYTEVVTSVSRLRFEHGTEGIRLAVNGVGGVTTRTYDRWGRVTSHTDAVGATTKWSHDELGTVTSETDADGRTISCERDAEGRETEVTDPAGGTIKISRDRFGNIESMTDQVGGTTYYVNDARGMVVQRTGPTGEVTKFEYDGQGNLVAETLPTGEVRQFRHDYWGRLLEKRLPMGATITYEWYPSGLLARQTDSLGRTHAYTHDGLGNVTSCVHPDGGRTTLHWGGLGWLHLLEHPDGTRAEARFNREGWPLEVVSENGARHVYEFDRDGRAVRETTFNGALQRTGYDLRGRVTWIEDASGRREFELNGSGQILKETAPDGSERVYDYDPMGEVIGVRSGGVELRIKRSPTGEIVGETMVLDGQQYDVDAGLDLSGRRTSLATSLGLALRYELDALGRLRGVHGDKDAIVSVRRDLQTGKLVRELSRGGVVRDTFDTLGRLRQRQVIDDRQAAAGEPAWVGEFHGTVDRRYDYTVTDEVAIVESLADGKVSYDYDRRRRLVHKDVNGAREAWTADAGSNYYEASVGAPARRYAEGDRLVKHGDVDFVYDDDGYLIEKHRRTAEGVESWRFRWGPWHELQAVECPDGRTVEFTYDGFMRRVGKRVLREGNVVSSTLWVWDRTGPVHEVVTDGATGEQRARTFVYDDDSTTVPFAQRDGDGGWVYYVKGTGGAPEDLVDGRGDVLAHLRRTTFGRVERSPEARAETPFRFEGQYEDDETGLHYNRFRYYDPDTGRYISPDPLGLEAGRNLYAYTRNPIGWIDPFGLVHGVIVEQSDVPGVPVGTTASSGMAGFPAGDAFFHPRAQARLHSERALLADLHARREASENAGNGNPLAGRSLRIRGTRPPCYNCHRAMRAFVDQNQMGGIDYVWTEQPHGGDSAVRYTPGNNPQFGGFSNGQFNATGAGKHAQQLATAYQMTGGDIKAGQRRDVNRESTPGGYRYRQEAGARTTYETINAQYN